MIWNTLFYYMLQSELDSYHRNTILSLMGNDIISWYWDPEWPVKKRHRYSLFPYLILKEVSQLAKRTAKAKEEI